MIHITALARGGYSAYGSSRYDPRADAVIVQAIDSDETRAITVLFPETISSVSEEENGISGTTPVITDSSFTATLSSLTCGASIKYLVTTASGVRALWIQVDQAAMTDCESDYGRW